MEVGFEIMMLDYWHYSNVLCSSNAYQVYFHDALELLKIVTAVAYVLNKLLTRHE